MHLVDDVDLGAGHHRAVAHALDQLADVVDAGVGRGVHLDDVDVAGLDDGLAVGAEARHADRRDVDRFGAVARGAVIVARAGHDARRGGLADAAHPAQEIGLVDAPEVEGVGQRADQRLLADQVAEVGRAILAGQDPVGVVERHAVSLRGAADPAWKRAMGPAEAELRGGKGRELMRG